MKATIHPTYYPDAKIVCSCGNTFSAGSTKQLIQVEVCSKCHPFYTGEHRFVDTKGKVEKFQKRMQAAAEMKKKISTSKKKTEDKSGRNVKSLRELLSE